MEVDHIHLLLSYQRVIFPQFHHQSHLDWLQGMMNRGQIEVCSVKKGEGDVCMQSDDRNPSKPKPLVIHFTKDVTTQRPRGFHPFTVKMPTPFPYKSDKAVPWKYVAQGSDRRKDAFVIRVKEDLLSAKVTNIFGTSGMTCIERIFVVPELPIQSKDKGKAKANIGERDKAGPTLDDRVPVGKITEEGEGFSKKAISVEEAIEFLRIIQQSDFKVIEQLNKTPGRISLLGLLMNSEPHQALLVKILNEAMYLKTYQWRALGA